MPVISTTTHILPMSKGRIEVRYSMTDHLGVEIVTTPRVVSLTGFNQDLDKAKMILVVEGQLINKEVLEYLESFKRGVNPFRDNDGAQVPPKHQSYIELLSNLFEILLNLDVKEVLEYSNALSFVNTLDDTTLSLIVPTTTPTKLRSWVMSLQVAANAIADYEVGRNG